MVYVELIKHFVKFVFVVFKFGVSFQKVVLVHYFHFVAFQSARAVQINLYEVTVNYTPDFFLRVLLYSILIALSISAHL